VAGVFRATYSLNLEPFDDDSTVFTYDASGNQYLSRQTKEEGGFPHNVIVRSYFGADERLHATQRIDEGSGGNRGVWEEYRYDPLGRRVLVRAVRQGQVTPASSPYSIQVCTGTGTACVSTVTRYVWAGDQVLWEMRSPGADGQNLENTTALGAAAGQSHLFGRVSYLHAGGIDRPLTIWKENVGSVLPHQNWRGLFSRGTWGYGGQGAVGTTANCVTINVNECLPLNWPGERTTAWHESGGESELWMGGLVDGMRDPTGQIYMRNRYYNPQTGQFTQMDPIGIAGGLNAYGFAEGDPVTYSDPYGLNPSDTTFSGAGGGDAARQLWYKLRADAQTASASDDVWVSANGYLVLSSATRWLRSMSLKGRTSYWLVTSPHN
jgi:RHS repeat-associated protein